MSNKLLDTSALIVSIIAVVISITGLIFANDSLKTAKEYNATIKDYNEKYFRPQLVYSYKLSIDNKQGGYLKIKNVGNAAAEITKIRVLYQDKEIHLIKQDGSSILVNGFFNDLSANTLSRLARERNIIGMFGSTLSVGEFIAKDDSLTLFEISPSKFSDSQICQQDKLRKSFVKDLQIEVTYRSLYGFEQTLKPAKPTQNPHNC